jgi:FimV-like protein
MMNDINNNQLAKMFANDPDRIKVSCTTCHHGTTEPRKIEDVLWDTYSGNGAEKAIDQYKDLREKYYGSFTYDFREFSLIQLASRCEQQKKYDDAIKFLDLNTNYFPDSQFTKMTLASVYIDMDQKDKATSILNDLIKAHPENDRAKRMLDRISR